MEDKKSDEIKAEYEKLRQKYNLPEYQTLVEEFDVDKELSKYQGIIIREIRRAIGEKFSAYLHFLETLLNPSSPSLFVYSFLKTMTEKQKQEIKSAYKTISKFQIETMKLDTFFNEKKEAEFILNAYTRWQELKKEMFNLIEQLGKDLEEDKKEKSYFG
jgi:hypothetical protein